MEYKVFLLWYLMMFLFGIIGLPIANYFFGKWRDKGYGLAKLIGLFAVGMPVWFLSSIKILPFSSATSIFFFLLALSLSLFWLFKHYKDYKSAIKIIIIEELLFFLNFAFWTFIRGYNARAEGTEKMMNIAFMNSISRAEFFPPNDPWFSGGTINYYYLGHYLYTFIGKVSGIAISYVYNYSLVTITSCAFVSLFSIIIELLRKSHRAVKYSLATMGAFWICYGGNMHYISAVLTAFFSQTQLTYFFPDATRIIPFAIDEFPAYSIVLGDVHGHYLGFPFFIIAIALVMVAYKIKLFSIEKFKFNALISVFVFVLYGINSWDFITVNALFFVLHIVQAFDSDRKIGEKVLYIFIAEVTLLLPGLIFMIFYLTNFNAPVAGEGNLIGRYVGFVPTFVMDTISKGQSILYKAQEQYKGDSPFKIWMIGKWQEDRIPWIKMWGMFIFISLGFVLSKVTRSIKSIPNQKLMNILTIVTIGLIVGVEFFFVKDIFHSSNAPYFRTNSIFKFYYHAWVIWGILCTWMIGIIISNVNTKNLQKSLVFNIPIIVFAFLMFIGSVVYIQKAINDFYPVNKQDALWTMDGIDYIKKEADKTGDYYAIEWLNENVKGQPVIAEVVGEAYTYAARISTYTGLPTVLGWPTHEWQWRGSSDIAFNRKNGTLDSAGKTTIPAFDLMYSSSDVEAIIKIINYYNIEYIVVGEKERELNPKFEENAIPLVADIVYENDYDTRIYKVNPFKMQVNQNYIIPEEIIPTSFEILQP